MIARSWGVGKMGDGNQNAQTSTYKMKKLWGPKVQPSEYS